MPASFSLGGRELDPVESGVEMPRIDLKGLQTLAGLIGRGEKISGCGSEP